MSEPAEKNPPPGRLSPAVTRVVLVVAIVAAAAALFWPRPATSPMSAPGGTLVDPNGRPVPLARELKPVTLVHFWATWCPPCRPELPELVRFAREVKNPRFGVVFVAVADEPAAARSFFDAPDLNLLFDPTWDVAHRFGTDQIPETHLLVDGKVVHSFIGATAWGDPAVRAQIQKWIATPPSATP